MAVTWKAGSSAVDGSAAVVTIPASVVAGDLLVAHTSNKNASGYLVVPDGWVYALENVGTLSMTVLWRMAETGDAGTTVTFAQEASTANSAAIIDVFESPDPIRVFNGAIEDAGTVSNPLTPSVESDWDCLLICGTAQETAAGATSAVAPLTLATDEPNSSETITVTTGYDQVGPGSTGTREFSRGTSARSKTSALLVGAPPYGFPDVAGSVTSQQRSGNVLTVALPPDIKMGDGLFIFLGTNVDAGSVTDWAGFTQMFYTELFDPVLACAYKTAAGDEGASVDVTLQTGYDTVATSIRIDVATMESFAASPPESNTRTSESTVSDRPPNLTPSWGEADTLWLTAATIYTQNGLTVETMPPRFGSSGGERAPGQLTQSSVMNRPFRASSLRPGAYTYANTSVVVLATIAVKPSGGAGGGWGAIVI